MYLCHKLTQSRDVDIKLSIVSNIKKLDDATRVRKQELKSNGSLFTL